MLAVMPHSQDARKFVSDFTKQDRVWETMNEAPTNLTFDDAMLVRRRNSSCVSGLIFPDSISRLRSTANLTPSG